MKSRLLIACFAIILIGCDLFPTSNKFVVSSVTDNRGEVFCIRGTSVTQKFYLRDTTHTLKVGDTLKLELIPLIPAAKDGE